MAINKKSDIEPDDSFSGIMEGMGISTPLKAINQNSMNTNTALLEDYSRKQKVQDYRIDDFYFRDPKNKLGGI